MCSERTDTHRFDRLYFGIENMQRPGVYRTSLLRRPERQQGRLAKHPGRYVLCVYLPLIVMNEFNHIGVFFKSCSMNNLAIASGDAFTPPFPTAFDS